ncbi:hypothetical protein NY406_04465 [Chlorobaculum sp. MV4-Y]|jgi:hypothetical protein|uniref:hypothetical protein n=1 Tax=Chlorobaculum sp. MV4-Y TaxID=2976335 RepID=UPI0021AF51B4|nr:hypothetical protein [Chlorobaculum sp. MV4-Y]UWX58522.1 hypothetical protein NY406_04465 [Chlorobaculum sp. MV4-Y]
MNNEKRNALEAHYQPIVEEIVEHWASGKPPNPSPAATSNKPSGYFRLTNWLLDYLVLNGEFPKGVHMMPEGRDRLGQLEPSFPVDFDLLTEGWKLTKP